MAVDFAAFVQPEQTGFLSAIQHPPPPPEKEIAGYEYFKRFPLSKNLFFSRMIHRALQIRRLVSFLIVWAIISPFSEIISHFFFFFVLLIFTCNHLHQKHIRDVPSICSLRNHTPAERTAVNTPNTLQAHGVPAECAETRPLYFAVKRQEANTALGDDPGARGGKGRRKSHRCGGHCCRRRNHIR